jgi:hypothetical protein
MTEINPKIVDGEPVCSGNGHCPAMTPLTRSDALPIAAGIAATVVCEPAQQAADWAAHHAPLACASTARAAWLAGYAARGTIPVERGTGGAP